MKEIRMITMTRLNLTLATAALALTTACAGTGGPNDNVMTGQGAAIGAGLGALVGAATGDDKSERIRNGLIGASLGAAAGATVGNQMDKQEQELRNQLGGNVGIVNNGQNLTVTLPQDILFATNSTSVSGAAQGNLATLANSLRQYPNSTVNVIGHTDDVGDAAFNFDLSQRRAQAVSAVLANYGVSNARIRSIGRGEDQPVATNLTAEGRAQNRRVDIVITPN
ncbi:MAG: OmpA family protein [Alphaproteobacteria bacterium]|jgi:outer membrane protein OmpA-like peptidoglycan-associated protein|nr:OmpA family protein [Alphaproteobacteria bacterium]MBU0862163.1 OmpA family protein [Alphaproteobacteria bacterium]MBU1836373.1 OmpA family protein [Alphaproteobacteria bacterium]UTH44211.1 OmpA family protein [Loktanella salsilacus]UTH47919.1 OmpA family protein [Loktanella salsilacus]|tara:strand:+ start:609 stop:1280 length:672 start_codon:yes stop_codon:yes gene_type:complete